MPAHPADFPLHDSGYPLFNQHGHFDPVDSIKVWELILNQINWSKVKQNSRVNPDIYQHFFETIIYPYIEKLLKGMEYNVDRIVGSRDNKDTSAKSESNSTEDDFENNSQYFEDNDSLFSDENGYGSADYVDGDTDNETEDDKGSEDEDQMENNHGEIDD